MHKKVTIEIPKWLLALLNHFYEIECKVDKVDGYKNIDRNIERIKAIFRTDVLMPDGGIYYEDPMGQSYDETRSDLSANISGESTEDLIVVDVIKPIIRVENNRRGTSTVVQKGVVIVESNTKKEGVEE